jgi:HK97 family phage prohead protease
MLVRKTLSLSNVELKADGDKGTFAGYASVFGGVDTYGDTIIKGAFEYSLRNNGKPKMFYDHRWDMPIGKYTVAKEDDKGLYVEGEFTPNLSLATDVRAAMVHGTIDGLSIGGFLKKGDYDETENGRIIRRWTNLIEVSPVLFPADGAARIDAGSVKFQEFSELILGDIEEIDTVREYERFLRDVGGLSKSAVQALTARAKVVFAQRDAGQAADAEMKAIADRVARLSSELGFGN